MEGTRTIVICDSKRCRWNNQKRCVKSVMVVNNRQLTDGSVLICKSYEKKNDPALKGG